MFVSPFQEDFEELMKEKSHWSNSIWKSYVENAPYPARYTQVYVKYIYMHVLVVIHNKLFLSLFLCAHLQCLSNKLLRGVITGLGQEIFPS